MTRPVVSRLVALAKRPATWSWVAAVVSAIGAGGAASSPELRELAGVGLAALIQALAGG